MSSKPYLVSDASAGSYAIDFGAVYQNVVVAVSHPSTKQIVYTIDQGVGTVWSTGLVSATSSTGSSITVTTSTRAFDKVRLVVSANGSTSATATKVYLGAF